MIHVDFSDMTVEQKEALYKFLQENNYEPIEHWSGFKTWKHFKSLDSRPVNK